MKNEFFTKINISEFDKNIKKDIKNVKNPFKIKTNFKRKTSKLLNLEINLQNCKRSGFLK
jgi:hypothetical protein